MKKYIIIILTLLTVAIYAAPTLFEQGEQARSNGKISQARKYFFKFFTRNPQSKYAPVAMYRYALSNIPYKEAVAYLNKILQKYPNYKGKYKIMDKIAMLHYLKDNYKECIRTLNDIVIANDANKNEKLRAYYYVGKSYLLLDKSKKSHKFFNLIIKAGNNPYRALAGLEIGEIYFKNKNYSEAKNAYENVVRNYPESEAELKAVYRLGLIYSYKREYDKAKAAYNYIIQSYPMSLEASFAKQKLKNLGKGYAKATENNIKNDYSPPEETKENTRVTNNNNNAETPLTQNNNGVRLTLHIGNYRAKHRRYAYHIYKKLKKRGFKAYIKKRKIKGRLYYTLRVGNFKSKNKALKQAFNIKRKLRLRVRIVDNKT